MGRTVDDDLNELSEQMQQDYRRYPHPLTTEEES
jgi:hypothetical protein